MSTLYRPPLNCELLGYPAFLPTPCNHLPVTPCVLHGAPRLFRALRSLAPLCSDYNLRGTTPARERYNINVKSCIYHQLFTIFSLSIFSSVKSKRNGVMETILFSTAQRSVPSSAGSNGVTVNQ